MSKFWEMKNKKYYSLALAIMLFSMLSPNVTQDASALTKRDFSIMNDNHITASYGISNVCGDHKCKPGEYVAWYDKLWQSQKITSGLAASSTGVISGVSGVSVVKIPGGVVVNISGVSVVNVPGGVVVKNPGGVVVKNPGGVVVNVPGGVDSVMTPMPCPPPSVTLYNPNAKYFDNTGNTWYHYCGKYDDFETHSDLTVQQEQDMQKLVVSRAFFLIINTHYLPDSALASPAVNSRLMLASWLNTLLMNDLENQHYNFAIRDAAKYSASVNAVVTDPHYQTKVQSLFNDIKLMATNEARP